MRTLLITAPFTQLNTPYPATAYIKGYLNTIGHESYQVDLGLETILSLFSSQGLSFMFDVIGELQEGVSDNAKRIFALRSDYITTIDQIISFLQNQDPTLAYRICEGQFLPEASKFDELEDFQWAFGTMGIRDQARHLATLYLEDLGDFITEVVDPYFGFSRYAERLGLSASSFEDIYRELYQPSSIISDIMTRILDDIASEYNPDLICFSVPFPGNLFATLKCGQYIKTYFPEMKVAIGGGYPNTELRSLTERKVFEFVDYITLDDGETPLRNLIEHLAGSRDLSMLKRTFSLVDNKVVYHNGSLEGDVNQENVGTPDYHDLHLTKYLSVIQLANPMHRVWNDGRWNKLTMAHGCYWGKCTFCDISLDYIKNYEASSASTIVDRMETLIQETGESGFHFVDEAAPPALMKAVALEILKRKLTVTWWTNIRFEKSFHLDLCRLLAASGCVAVSGGLEVASDRLLKLIDKGVTIEQVTQVNANFTEAGIMVHAYLMYGFPTQTTQETIDSLEVVRQMFEAGIMQSGFWHRFAMTAHSPVGIEPSKFNVAIVDEEVKAFANNDLEHLDPDGTAHESFSKGLKKSIYNFMHGVCIDQPVETWFDHKVPATTHPKDLIENYLQTPNQRAMKPSDRIVWIGGPIETSTSGNNKSNSVIIHTKQETHTLVTTEAEAVWLRKTLASMTPDKAPFTYKKLAASYENAGLLDFTLFWYGGIMEKLKSLGLIIT